MFLRFPGPTDLESRAREYCLEVLLLELGELLHNQAPPLLSDAGNLQFRVQLNSNPTIQHAV